jgi:uncharacterized cupin superfamily protein
MSGFTLIPPGGGEIVGDSPDRRVEILSDDDSLHATWSRFGPRRDGADLHVHHHHTDLFYVLDGELTIRLGIDDERVAVSKGTLARVPALVVHGFLNATEAEVRYLNMHAPGQGFADFMRSVREGRPITYDQVPPPSDGGRPTTEAVVGQTEVLADGDGRSVVLHADEDRIRVTEVSGEPGGAVAAPRTHADSVESVYVLDGTLGVRAGDRDVRAASGAWMQFGAGCEHAISIAGPQPARYLTVQTPARAQAPG